MVARTERMLAALPDGARAFPSLHLLLGASLGAAGSGCGSVLCLEMFFFFFFPVDKFGWVF